MIRIIQFKINRESLIDSAEFNRSAVEHIHELTKLESDGDVFLTERMATSEPRFFEIEGYLRSIFGDRSKWDVIDVSAEYKVIRTSAPKDYDYGYVIELGDAPEAKYHKPERLVAMPESRVEYQSGRYSSGLHSSWPCS